MTAEALHAPSHLAAQNNTPMTLTPTKVIIGPTALLHCSSDGIVLVAIPYYLPAMLETRTAETNTLKNTDTVENCTGATKLRRTTRERYPLEDVLAGTKPSLYFACRAVKSIYCHDQSAASCLTSSDNMPRGTPPPGVRV